MPTRTKPQPSSRIGRRPTPAPQGRFHRSAATPQGRFHRPAAAPQGRFHRPARRKAPQPSTSRKAMTMVTDALAKPAAKKRSAKGRKAGRMALLAGGVGLAMKNRDKLTGLLSRRQANKSAAAGAQPGPPTPAA